MKYLNIIIRIFQNLHQYNCCQGVNFVFTAYRLIQNLQHGDKKLLKIYLLKELFGEVLKLYGYFLSLTKNNNVPINIQCIKQKVRRTMGSAVTEVYLAHKHVRIKCILMIFVATFPSLSVFES